MKSNSISEFRLVHEEKNYADLKGEWLARLMLLSLEIAAYSVAKKKIVFSGGSRGGQGGLCPPLKLKFNFLRDKASSNIRINHNYKGNAILINQR